MPAFIIGRSHEPYLNSSNVKWTRQSHRFIYTLDTQTHLQQLQKVGPQQKPEFSQLLLLQSTCSRFQYYELHIYAKHQTTNMLCSSTMQKLKDTPYIIPSSITHIAASSTMGTGIKDDAATLTVATATTRIDNHRCQAKYKQSNSWCPYRIIPFCSV